MIEHNGKMFARVSEILNPFKNFIGIDSKVLENKARIGTSVHQAIADDISMEFPSPDPDGLGYYQSYEVWKSILNPKFAKSEERYFCEEKMITGKIDSLIHLGLDFQIPILIDFKTSAQECKDTWPMQAHLYAYLLAVNGISVQPRYLFVKLNKMGKAPDVFEYKWSENTHARCMNAISYFWKNEAAEIK